MSEEKTLLGTLKGIILGLVEVDQEAAVLDNIYREQSQKKLIARLDETIASISLFKEDVKAKRIEGYIEGKNFNHLRKK